MTNRATKLTQLIVGPVSSVEDYADSASESRGEVVLTQRASFDPTSASQVDLFTLPIGARVLDVVSLGGATGGASPTVDVGISGGDDDAFANELDADGVSSALAAGTTGASYGAILTADTVVAGKVGASAATGGTTTIEVKYALATNSIADPSSY